MIGADIFEKLKGGELDARDRSRLDFVLLFCAAVVIGLLVWKPPVDTKIAELAMSNAWITGMVALVVYVFGAPVKRTRAVPAPPSTTINVNPAQEAPPAIAADVKEVKADVKAVKKKVQA